MESAPRVFISYSHDSPEHKRNVLALANRLRKDDGIDVSIDQYVPAPPEGWPRWMDQEITKADFVLLVCTEIYYQRVSMNALAGEGLGALWESNLIFQYVYEAGTVNSKFIPILPLGGSAQHIPTSLRGVQRYEPFEESGYWDLYRRLTNQPAVEIPALGERRILGPLSAAPIAALSVRLARDSYRYSTSPRAAIISATGSDSSQAFIPVIESNWGEREVMLTVEPDNASDEAFLDGLRSRRNNEILLAFRNSAAQGYVREVLHLTKEGKDRWIIKFNPSKTDFSNLNEMSMDGLTADQAATLRARRLLLNEGPANRNNRDYHAMQEMMIAGSASGQFGAVLKIHGSPFPQLYSVFGDQPAVFIEAAWILAVLQLKMSGTVEQITRLHFVLRGWPDLIVEDKILQVVFTGLRRKQYTNQAAFRIDVAGNCAL